jgi:hypothetical protein
MTSLAIARAKEQPHPIATTAAKKRPAPTKAGPVAAAAPDPRRAVRGRPRLYDERQALITRLTPEQYRRVRQLALDAHTTVQDLVVAGLSSEFVRRGLEPL